MNKMILFSLLALSTASLYAPRKPASYDYDCPDKQSQDFIDGWRRLHRRIKKLPQKTTEQLRDVQLFIQQFNGDLSASIQTVENGSRNPALLEGLRTQQRKMDKFHKDVLVLLNGYNQTSVGLVPKKLFG